MLRYKRHYVYNSANFAGLGKGVLHTQLVIMLIHSVFFLLKMNTTLFQILQIIQLKVISYLDTDHLPFLEKGKGWMGGMICIDSPSGNIQFN
jgi:hypothetical protein